MLSNRPYLLRAFYEWIVDSQCTPILVIDANNPNIRAPMAYAEDGEIVFNISSNAVRDLKMSNDKVEFKASFSGVIHIVNAPIGAILAVYAEENGEGIFFDAEEDTDGTTNVSTGVTPLRSVETTPRNLMDSADVPPDVMNKSRVKPFLKLVE